MSPSIPAAGAMCPDSDCTISFTRGGIQLIPDVLANWAWRRAINPLYDEVSEEANPWFKSFKLFTPKSQHAFDRGDMTKVAAMAVPHGSREHLRSCMDFSNVVFSIDEYTDRQPPPIVQELVDGCIDVIHKHTSEEGRCPTVFDQFFSQFWTRAMKVATPQSAKQLARAFTDYLNGTHQEAEGTTSEAPLNFESYLQVRLESIGIRVFYAVCGLPLSIPDEVFDDPLFVELQYLGSELLLLDNDIISYNRERATSIAKFNSITVIMAQFKLSYADAVDWLAGRIAELEIKYMKLHEDFASRSYGNDADRTDVLALLELMGNLRAAVFHWSFESGRYFGIRGEETRKTH
ncbi:hypothetical protein ONZ51_g4967 [Trametes cubensis]|uniref:Terpene synthase n=1 Tax=Trametes cubensis TaxID=1111947 RepID=A0AAD7XBY0_9APHY|nr:hypothetical protein ONZ51_g4967 [Trametes cubensis]